MVKQQDVYASLAPMGFETAGQWCYGVADGYAVSLRPNGSYYVAVYAVRADQTDKGLRKRVHSAVKARGLKRYRACASDKNTFQFTVVLDQKSPYEQQLRAFFEAFSAALRQEGVQPAPTCAVCGGSAPDSLCLVDGYQPVHARCIHDVAENTREQAQQNQENGSYLTGTIGAILGALVGLIPNVLTIVYMERIYGVLFALVPLAAMFGYRLLKGKQNKAAVVIVIILSLLAVFVQETVVVSIAVAQTYSAGFGESFAFAASYLLSADGFGDMLKDCVQQFLFMALGIFIAWKYLAQTNATNVANADAVVSTLKPMRSEDESELGF